jgi:EpsI family protein
MDIQLKRRALVLVGASVALSAAGVSLRPGELPPVTTNAEPILPGLFPEVLGSWRTAALPARTISPDTEALLNKLYSELLERVYVNDKGEQIMLAVAYGADQRGGLEAHKPEVCYPAQGFAIQSNRSEQLTTPHGPLIVRRLFATMEGRPEPITYWFTMSEKQVESRWEKRWVELQSMMTGRIPDGLLVRISSIQSDPQAGWERHTRFISDFLNAVDAKTRARVAGQS